MYHSNICCTSFRVFNNNNNNNDNNNNKHDYFGTKNNNTDLRYVFCQVYILNILNMTFRVHLDTAYFVEN